MVGLVWITGVASGKQPGTLTVESAKNALRSEITEAFDFIDNESITSNAVAFVRFKTHADGTVSVVAINSADTALKDYILLHVGDIELNIDELIPNAEYNFKLQFNIRS